MMGIAWGITGAGHLLRECIELISELGGTTGQAQGAAPTYTSPTKVDVFVSRAAEEVLRMYHLEAELQQAANTIVRDNMASSPIVGRFARRSRYRVLVIAPATSNSVAKFVWGISDSLISNLFAQAGKSRVPIVVLPTDIAPDMDSVTPNDRIIKVYPRAIDLENTARLRQFSNVTVVEDVEEIQKWLNTYL